VAVKRTLFDVSKNRLVLCSLVLTISLSLSIAPVLADGNILRSFDAPVVIQSPTATYFPIGIAFDGKNLYYSQPASTPGIVHITTTGSVLGNVPEVNNAGAVTWDGTYLWVGIAARRLVTCESGQTGCALIFQVNPSTGNVIKTVDVSSIFASDQECNDIDGLSFDPSNGSLWVSPDPGCLLHTPPGPCGVGFVYNVDTSGNLISRLKLPFGVGDVDVAGNNLYLSSGGCGTTVYKTDRTGNVLSSFTITQVDPHTWPEGLAFDPTSFAPNCALWTMQPYFDRTTSSLAADVVAYQVGCS
jgi:hypothetical protein